MRYQVYCDELGYEDKSQFLQPLERDRFDPHSQHFLIRHKRTGLAAGTARCVVPFDMFGHKQPLPSELFCRHALDPSVITAMGLRRGDYAEVSRIAIPAVFRRCIPVDHPMNLEQRVCHFSPEERVNFPHIATCLYFALAAFYQQCDAIQSMIAMMEPRLMKHLNRAGIYFQPAGQLIDYHGSRQAFILYKDDLLTNIKPLFKPFFESVRKIVDAELASETPLALEIA